MFNIGFGEFLIIAVLLIIVVGPDRLPALMRTVGRTLRSVRKASDDLRASAGLDELLNQDPMSPPRKRRGARERGDYDTGGGKIPVEGTDVAKEEETPATETAVPAPEGAPGSATADVAEVEMTGKDPGNGEGERP
jgi:sec-independent protein translocase protein TatB